MAINMETECANAKAYSGGSREITQVYIIVDASEVASQGSKQRKSGYLYGIPGSGKHCNTGDIWPLWAQEKIISRKKVKKELQVLYVSIWRKCCRAESVGKQLLARLCHSAWQEVSCNSTPCHSLNSHFIFLLHYLSFYLFIFITIVLLSIYFCCIFLFSLPLLINYASRKLKGVPDVKKNSGYVRFIFN